MKRTLNSLSIALAGAALLTACSRPVAYFQPSKAERFQAAQPVVVATPTEASANVPVTEPTQTEVLANVPVAQPDALPVAQKQQATEALASLKTTYATNKRLTKRIEKAERMLADASTQNTAQPAAPAKKAGLAQRLMLKSIDKKIQKHLAPKDSLQITNYVRVGAIVALVGLLLLLIGNGLGATIGLIALIAGLVLILLGVINQG
jgi:hypothetical protein